MEAEGAFFRLGQRVPVGASGFQQAVGADDIGLNEVRRPIDGAVDMGLSRQVHDGVWLETCQYGAHGGLVDNIGLHELVASVGGNAGQRFEIARIGQFVQVEHFMLGVPNQLANQGRADETGAAGDKNTHVGQPFFPSDDIAKIIACRQESGGARGLCLQFGFCGVNRGLIIDRCGGDISA
ncbi:hypothetical protein D3C84_659840 [compost metagenome]